MEGWRYPNRTLPADGVRSRKINLLNHEKVRKYIEDPNLPFSAGNQSTKKRKRTRGRWSSSCPPGFNDFSIYVG